MTTPATTTDNAPAVQEPARKTLTQLINDMLPEIALALPKHLTPERMVRIAKTALKQTPKLGECTPDSFLGALMTSVQLGLEPNTPLGHAYLVPFKNKNKATGRFEMVCTFIPGYRGLAKLAMQSDQLTEIDAEIVYENDDFKYRLGIDRYIHHDREFGAPRGNPIGAYAFAKFVNGGRMFEVMTLDEIEAIRKRSRAADNGPWVTDWEEMAKKTVFKRLAKWLPLSTELAIAANFDSTVRTDLTHQIVDVQPNYVDGEVVEDAGELARGPQPTRDNPEVPVDEPPADPAAAASSADQKAIRQIFALLKKADIESDNREDRLIIYRAMVGRPDINSTNDLQPLELEGIAGQLSKWDKAGTLGSEVTEILNRASLAEMGRES